jgi:hypothetical protein
MRNTSIGIREKHHIAKVLSSTQTKWGPFDEDPEPPRSSSILDLNRVDDPAALHEEERERCRAGISVTVARKKPLVIMTPLERTTTPLHFHNCSLPTPHPVMPMLS